MWWILNTCSVALFLIKVERCPFSVYFTGNLYCFVSNVDVETNAFSLVAFRLQSVIDGLASLMLFLAALTVRNTYIVELGLRGQLHCLVWKSRLFKWWMFGSSTYNIVFMSIERYYPEVADLKHSFLLGRFVNHQVIGRSFVFPDIWSWFTLYGIECILQRKKCMVRLSSSGWSERASTFLINYSHQRFACVLCFVRVLPVISMLSAEK